MFGWSFLEGIGAALILPAIVALVASNFGPPERPRAYGLVAAAGAIAVAVGPLIGGLFTTYWSWRYVFVGEVLIVLVILLLDPADRPTRRRSTAPGSTWSAPRSRRSGSASSSSASCGRARGGSCSPSRTRPTWLGLSPVDLADPRRRRRAAGCSSRWENRRVDRGARAAGRPGDPAQPDAARRADRVLLPVPAPGRPVLRGAAVPVGRARAVGDRHRRAAAAAVDHPAARRGRHPEVASPTRRRGGSCSSASCCAVRRDRRVGRRARRRRRARRSSRGRCCSPASASARSPRSSARDRLVGPRRAERRGRRPAEHGHEPRRLDRHRARRRGADLGAHRVVLHRHRSSNPAVPDGPHVQGARPSSPAACRSSPTPTSRPRSTKAGVARATADAIVDENANARLDALRASLSVLAVLALIALVLQPEHPHAATCVRARWTRRR